MRDDSASRLFAEEEPTVQSVIVFTNLLQERFPANPWTVPALVDIEPALLISSLFKPVPLLSSLIGPAPPVLPPPIQSDSTATPIESVSPAIESVPPTIESVPAVIKSIPPLVESVPPVIESAHETIYNETELFGSDGRSVPYGATKTSSSLNEKKAQSSSYQSGRVPNSVVYGIPGLS